VLLDLFSGGGWGVLTCVAVSCLAQLLLLVPAWMYRDPADAARSGPRELSARRAA